MLYTVKSWNELLSDNTNKLKSSNSLGHRAKPKNLEAEKRTRQLNHGLPVLQSKTSRANRRRHMVIRDPIPEVQFCDGEVDTRIVLHACYARKNDSVMHADSLTLRLISLSYYLLIAKT